MSIRPELDPRSKILSNQQVDDWIARERAASRRLGYTCGSFDILHAGHCQYLARARDACDRLLVAVNSDASVRRYKSPLRPVNGEELRMYVIAGLGSVDAVTILEDDRPLQQLLRWKPDFYIKGGTYESSSLRSAPAVEAYGGRVLVIASDFETSTTGMMERIGAILAHDLPAKPTGGAPRGLVLLDRDGTLIRDIPFLHDPAQLELMPGAGEALAALQAAGFALAVATNQQGVGLGYFTTQQMIAVNQQLFRALRPFGVKIAKIYYCPHSAAENCVCRKPQSGLIRKAMQDFSAGGGRTFMVGDASTDAEAGRAAGCRTILVNCDSGCDYRAVDLTDAARWILAQPLE